MAKQTKERRFALRASFRPLLALWLVGWTTSTYSLTHHAEESHNKRQTRPVGPRHYAPNSPTSRPTPLLGTSCHHSSLAVLTCSLRKATASHSRDIIGTPPSRHNMEGEHGTSCRFPLPDSPRKESTVHLALSTSSSNLSTSALLPQWVGRLTEEGEHLHTLVIPTLLLKNILTDYMWMLCYPV
jgi:hypothetical protein